MINLPVPTYINRLQCGDPKSCFFLPKRFICQSFLSMDIVDSFWQTSFTCFPISPADIGTSGVRKFDRPLLEKMVFGTTLRPIIMEKGSLQYYFPFISGDFPLPWLWEKGYLASLPAPPQLNRFGGYTKTSASSFPPEKKRTKKKLSCH